LKFLISLMALFFSVYLNAQVKTPTVLHEGSLSFLDDMEFANLKLALNRQLQAFTVKNLKGTIQFGTSIYQKTILKTSAERLLKKIEEYEICQKNQLPKENCSDEFSKKINAEFSIYKPDPAKVTTHYQSSTPVQQRKPEFDSKLSHFTAYYSPDLEGSTVQDDVYKHAVYGLPRDTNLRNLTRVQIDFEGKLKGKGLELFYVKNSLFDLYLFHIEGGGRIKVKQKDGSFKTFYLSFAGMNRHKFRMIYKYMLERGMITAENSSIDDQRQFLANHPELEKEVFEYCPSYIFFKVTETEPLGIKNIPLTEKRSLAMDLKFYPVAGILNFIKAKRPVRDNDMIIQKEFSRFFVHQDTGGAIKGPARSDLYFGFGPEAELTANRLQTYGEQYFLIAK
jgi:membrane-bound lytic murein transglycosylase